MGHRLHGAIPYFLRICLHPCGGGLVSKWVEAVPCRVADHKAMLKFPKENIFSIFEFQKQFFVMEVLTFVINPLRTSYPNMVLSTR